MFSRLSPVHKAILLALTGYTAFSVADICAKWLLKTYDLFQVLGLEHAVAALLLLILAPFIGGVRKAIQWKDAPVHGLRILLQFGLAIILNYSYSRFPLADVYALIFTKPFFAALLAYFIFAEKLSLNRGLAIGIGFAGVLIATRPGGANFDPMMILPLCSAGLIAILFMAARRLSNPGIISVSLVPIAGTAILMSPMMIASFEPMTMFDIGLLIILSASAAIGIVCVSMAFSMAPSAAVAPFMYTQMIWAVVFGYIIFGDVPDYMMLTGAAIIILSGLYLVETERRAGRDG
jgi:drug/metabolite transporter (DMT)-like permease